MKKITGLAAALLLLLSAAVGMAPVLGYAASGQTLIETVYQDNGKELVVVCALPGEMEGEESFEVMLSGTPLPILSVSTAEQAALPKTVYCLVDVSGSMKGRMEQVKSVLGVIGEGLNKGDSMVIGKLGNQTVNSGFLDSWEKIEEEIGHLEYTDEDTDLYGGILLALNFLQQEPEVHSLRYLVVLSDGYDRQEDGVTWNEVYDAVGKADIPVYTVAPVLSDMDYEKAKELGSFSRNTVGGIHFPRPDENGSSPLEMTEQEIGEEILQAMGETALIRVDLSGAQKPERDKYLLSVAFHDVNGKAYEDSKEFETRKLLLNTEVLDVEEETESGPAETEETKMEPDDKGNFVFPWVIGGVLAVGVLVAVLVAKRSGKKRQEKEERLLEQERQREEEKARQERERQEREKIMEESLREKARQKEEEAYLAIPRLRIRLTVLGMKDKVYYIQLVQGYEMTVGRNKKSETILNPEDKKLSGIHCVMLWDGASVYVWDGQSTNGTSVNGVVVDHLGRVEVVPGDILFIGSYEYRLYWEV